MATTNTKARRDIMEALHAGYHRPNEIRDLTNLAEHIVIDTLQAMLDEGQVSRPERGHYYPLTVTPAREREELGESSSGRVALQGYLLERTPGEVTFERDAQTFHQVIKVEVEQHGHWNEVRRDPRTRVFIGEDAPVWHADQVVLHDVATIRLTFADGHVKTYGHNVLHAVVVHGGDRG